MYRNRFTRHGWRALRTIALTATLPALAPGFAPRSAIAQQPAPTAQATPSAAFTILVRDAATGLPLDAVQATRLAAGTEHQVVARGDASGRLLIPANVATGRDGSRIGEFTLLIQRIGYEPRRLGSAEISSHLAATGLPDLDIRLTPRPALLSTISVVAATPNQLAAGTALAMATSDRSVVSERAATSLAESLDGMEGVTTSRVGAWGSKLSVRGLGGERLAFMVDGARVNRACTFGMDQGLATIDPSSVERVELLAGPGSTLYGSGNVGGVVNVVTRNPSLDIADGQVAGEVRLGASSAIPGGTAGAGIWTRRGRFDAALQLDGQNYGDYRTPTASVAGSSYRAATLDLKGGMALTPAQRLAAQFSAYSGRDIGWPSMAGGSIPLEDRRMAALDWGWQRGRGLVDAVSARAYVQRLDHHMLMDMVMPMGGTMPAMGGATMRSTTDARSYSTTSGARAQLRLRPDSRSHIDAGIEAVQWGAEGTRWVTNSSSGGMGAVSSEPTTTTYHSWPDVRILDLGLFAQGERQLAERFTVSAGARADHITKRADGWENASQTVATGNLGGRAILGAGFGLRTSAGLGYRIPDPTELFGTAARPDGFVYRGNPELSTEKGRTVEAGLTWDGAVHALNVHEASLSVTAFRNDLTGLITPSLVTGDSVGGKPVREYVNIQDARLTGLTSALRMDLAPAFQLRGTATYTRGENLQTSTPLAAIAPLTGTMTLRFAPNAEAGVLPVVADVGGWIEVEGRAGAEQRRNALQAGEQPTPGWSVLTLRAGARLAGTTLSVSVDNLLDRNFREHLDPVTLFRPGRNFSVRAARGF